MSAEGGGGCESHLTHPSIYDVASDFDYTLLNTNMMDPENHCLLEESNLPGGQDVRVQMS